MRMKMSRDYKLFADNCTLMSGIRQSGHMRRQSPRGPATGTNWGTESMWSTVAHHASQFVCPSFLSGETNPGHRGRM
jgi:hypothetical protein